jgi:hypothetical protein
MATLPQRVPRPHASPANGNGAMPAARQALAMAIAARSAAASDLARTESALAKAQHNARDANDALELAEIKLGESQGAAGTAAVEALLAGVKLNGSAVIRVARLAYAEAEDNVVIAKSAVKKLESVLPEKRKEVERASYEVIKAARAVVKAESPDLAAELRATIEKMHMLRAQLFWLYRNNACVDSPERKTWDQSGPVLSEQDQDYPTAVLLKHAGAGLGHDEKHDSFKSWDAAFGALTRDAAAPLPVSYASKEPTNVAGPRP